MSLTNFVQLRLQAGITAAATSMTVFAPATPFRLPDSSGTLVLTDSLMQPSKAEIVTYTGLVNNGNGTHSFTGLGRGAEGTTAQVWSAQANVVESVTAGVLASLLADKADIDDARLTDSREWTAETVTQADAEAGTETTRRAWTAQRVRQAIVAWWNSVSSAWGRGFVASADAGAGRTALGLGNAATATVQTSPTDTTAGRLMAVGAFGLGTVTPSQLADLNQTIKPSGLYYVEPSTLGDRPSSFGMVLIENYPTTGNICQTFTVPGNAGGNYRYFRTYNVSTLAWNPWQPIFHTGNILGPVSQSGGVPTGAIIERGINANGHYVRYADGTQICWGVSYMTTDTAYGTTGLYYSVYPSLTTLPASFVDASYRVASSSTSTNILPGAAVPDSGSAFRITGMYPANAAVIGTHWIAIGRWY